MVASLMMVGVLNASGLDNLGFSLQEEFRFKDTGDSWYYQHSDFQIKYKVSKYVDVFTDYRLIFQNKGGWDAYNVVMPGFTLKYPTDKWGKFEVRTRGQAALDASPVLWSLNIQPKYNFPWKWTKYEFNPYIADEIQWILDDNIDYKTNRVRVGIGWKFTKGVKGSLGYYYETSNKGHANVVNTSIKFEF